MKKITSFLRQIGCYSVLATALTFHVTAALAVTPEQKQTPIAQASTTDETKPIRIVRIQAPDTISNRSLPKFTSQRSATLTSQEKEALRLAKNWNRKTLKPIMKNGGRVSYVYGAIIPTIICTPFKIADLELEKGEIVNNILLGDTARWDAELVLAGTGADATPHITFKAIDSGLETSAIIGTNRRAYHLNLKSDKKKHTPYSGFIYAKPTKKILASIQHKLEDKVERNKTAEGFDISQLDFKYSIEGKASWRPVQVYSNGLKTYIKMPKSINQVELPVLMVATPEGNGLVNYRVKNDTFIIDQLFKKAVLIAGVGSKQEKVSIKRGEK
ncbi:P-type conjugative transfer protein TrbG [Desulfotalea psychrophila]|uniref:Probable conjugal transfer protein TrbG n=1 Tax=Desulfotalea psychrophila (strain LSv54 / DSM 12343) TaxID=177439 RepID=Q6AIG5_DESPS|nr:P-type conjugative transfer protein TrbG [Desulfotalea psychrophila]CAG37882.1 probable conjugal transfer protein TrbG [Desulfotalea psychrophila LSv54]